MNPEHEVLDRLQHEAARHRQEVYPGDLLADIRSRLTTPRSGFRPRWSVAAAAVLVVAALAGHLASRGPAPPVRTRSLSPFQTVPRVSALSAPRTLSPTPSGMGRALRLGAEALSSLRPPSRAGSVPKEDGK